VIFSVNRGFITGYSFGWADDFMKTYRRWIIIGGCSDASYYSSKVIGIDVIHRRSISSRSPMCQAFGRGRTESQQ